MFCGRAFVCESGQSKVGERRAVGLRGQPGFEFIEEVPTTWDQTRFVTGEPAQYVVVARRKDTTSYLGGINNWTGREILVPLHFLGPGNYDARLFVDGSPSGDRPDELRREQRDVTATDSIQVTLAPGGGFCRGGEVVSASTTPFVYRPESERASRMLFVTCYVLR